MTNHNTARSTRSTKRKAAPKQEVLEAPLEVVVTEEVVTEEVAATPIVEPAPEPTPIPEPTLAKPWEVVRPMAPVDNSAWQRGQKWRS